MCSTATWLSAPMRCFTAHLRRYSKKHLNIPLCSCSLGLVTPAGCVWEKLYPEQKTGTAWGQTHISFTQSSGVPGTRIVPGRWSERPCAVQSWGFSPPPFSSSFAVYSRKWHGWTAKMCYLGPFNIQPASCALIQRRHIVRRPSAALKMLKSTSKIACFTTWVQLWSLGSDSSGVLDGLSQLSLMPN